MFDLYPYLFDRSPETFADYYRFGADYVLEVSMGMEFDHEGLGALIDEAYAALERGDTDVRPAVAKSIAAVVLGDAEWFYPLADWQSTLPCAGNKVRTFPLVRALRSVGEPYAANATSFERPQFSEPGDVRIDGRPAIEYVDGADERLVLASSILHLEWYVDVARQHGIDVPRDLVESTRTESKRYFAGVDDDLSRPVKDFQYWLFQDVHWIEKFEARYGRHRNTDEPPTANRALKRVLEDDLV